jgi:hypothetical protein
VHNTASAAAKRCSTIGGPPVPSAVLCARSDVARAPDQLHQVDGRLPMPTQAIPQARFDDFVAAGVDLRACAI